MAKIWEELRLRTTNFRNCGRTLQCSKLCCDTAEVLFVLVTRSSPMWRRKDCVQAHSKVLFSLDQYIDELEVIGTNQPQHSSKFDMMSVVQEEEEESEMLEETTSERSASKISSLCFIRFLLLYLALFI